MMRGLGFVALFAAGTCAAADWRVVEAPSSASPGMDYDAARTSYEPPYVTTWTRVVLQAPARLSNGVEYRSTLQKVAIDCNTRTWGVTRFEFFGSANATGTPLYTYAPPRDEWSLRPAREGTNGAMLLHVLCATPRPW